MKDKIILIIFFVIFLVLLFFGYYYPKNYKVVEIRGQKFNIELAQTQEEKTLGLGQREKIGNDVSMLFIFDKSDKYSFWMNDMKFDLDILWIENGEIVYIKKAVSHKLLKEIVPSVKANKVLEINAGLAEKYGFEVGDEVTFY